ncbi:putative leucine-rich repeat-containing protein DDB_G0290503 [Palaemon carinicauda]|uniref:putative leucine-rich repeat-containing protein DDB_G0290503 n=1 Tax=Palaemon carinicauda TaxID=392227 RepID=UPI0035B5DAFA
MKRIKMQVTVVALCGLLQVTSAFYLTGHALLRAKRSAPNCSKETVENLAKSATETCTQVEAVDKYTANVQSKVALPVPTFTDRHGFKEILNQYNTDLGLAKEHCQPWRNGDNVVGSLKETVVAAQGFESKFNEELVKNQARIKNLLENHEDIATVESKIASLQKEIDEAKEAAKFTNVSSVTAHLESVISSKEEEINTTTTEHNIVQGRRELAELINYLEFVKTGAGEVHTKASTSNTKLGRFRENIIKDSTAFKRHRTNAQDGISKLQQEKQNNNNEITSNTQSISDLRAKITEENNQIASLNAQIASANREIREIEDRINSNLSKTKKRRRFGSIFRFVPIVGWTIGNKFYKDAKEREERLRNEKRNFVNENARAVQNLRDHIAVRTQDIASHETRIAALQAKSQELEQELTHFGQLDGNLQSLEGEVDAILPSLANAVAETGKMRSTFEAIQLSLGNTIEKAKEAKTEAEIQNMSYFIYNEIDDLKCTWENAKDKIVPVGQCN